MSAASARDEAAVRTGIERWLAARSGGSAIVTSLARPSAGYSGETNVLDVVEVVDGDVRTRSIVVRLAPEGEGTHPTFDLAAQAAAQVVAATAGVPVAVPLELELDTTWLGAAFLVMAKVDGHIVDDAVGHDRWVRSLDEDQQRRLYEGFVDVVAGIHDADAEAAVVGGVPQRGIQDELGWWDSYLRWSAPGGQPIQILVEAIERCRVTAPQESGRSVLLWGDVRLGNVVVGDDLEPQAVLDWDMCSVGAPEHDIAWLTHLDATMMRLIGTRAPGLLDREGVLARYEATAGRTLHDFEWFETFALLRSTALMTRIGYLQRAAGVDAPFPVEDNPILGLLRERL